MIVALVVDGVLGIQNFEAEQDTDSGSPLPGSRGLTAAIKGRQNIILVHHLEELLKQAHYQFPNLEELAPKSLHSHD